MQPSTLRSKMSNKTKSSWDDKQPISSYFLLCILNFLVEIKTAPNSEASTEDVKKLEEYIYFQLENNSIDPCVAEALDKYGWNGSQFDESSFNMYSFNIDVAKLYMDCHIAQDENSPEIFWSKENHRIEEFSLDKSSIMECFCPNILIEELANLAHGHMSLLPSVSCRSTFFFGAVLLVDISGFTALSSAFCREGVSGLDKLQTVTSGILGRLVNAVYAHDGDVINFAGDALICVFKTLKQSDSSKSSNLWDNHVCCPAIRALQCAIALSSFKNENLSVHTALGCGDVFLSTIGGYNGQWTYILNSPCIPGLSSCLDDAGPSQVAFSQEFYDVCVESLNLLSETNRRLPRKRADYLMTTVAFRAFGDDLQCTKMKSGNMLLEDLSLYQILPPHTSRFASLSETKNGKDLEHLIQCFVPRPVLHSVSIGSLNMLAELRHVTTVFIKLDSYDVEVHLNPISLQSFFYAVQELLGDFGGFLRQFIIDDKGCVVICMWGVPGYAFNNNECRAIDFSCQLNMKIRTLRHHCSIGIASGTVYCGNIGSVARRDYVAIGADVNLAARLMGKAKGGIWIDKMTHDKMSLVGQESAIALPPVKMKGLEKPVTPYTFDCDTMPTLCLSADGGSQYKLLRAVAASSIRFQLSKSLVRNSVVGKEKMESDKSTATTASISDFSQSISSMIGGSHFSKSVMTENASPNKNSEIQLYEMHSCLTYSYDLNGRSDDVLSRAASSAQFTIKKEEAVDILVCSPDEEEDMQEAKGVTVFPAANVYGEIQIPPSSPDSIPMVVPAFRRAASIQQLNVSAVSKKPNVNFTIIVGPHGTGKRTAALYYYRHAQSLGLCFIRIVASSRNRNMPYAVIRRLFRKLCKSNFSTDHQQRLFLRVLLNRAFPLEDSQKINARVATMLRILGLDEATCCTVQSMDNHDGSLHGCLLILLQSENYAICLENCHFCDELSWQQLRLMMDMPVHLSIMITLRHNLDENNVIARPQARSSFYRRKDSNAPKLVGKEQMVSVSQKYGIQKKLTSSYFAVAEHKSTVVVYMTALTELEVRQILAEVLASNFLSDTLVSFVFEISCGNLFWCNTLAKYIVEKGVENFESLIGADGRSQQALQVIVVAIYETLGSAQKMVIKHASIIGEEFTDGQLLAVLPLEAIPKGAKTVPGSFISPLINRGLIFCNEHSEDASYRFTNEVIRSVLYDLTPPSDAAMIHVSVAKHIECTHKDELASYCPILSYHCTMGLLRSDAFFYSAKAAEIAIECGSYGDALFYLDTAFAMVTTMNEGVKIKSIVTTALYDLEHNFGLTSRAKTGITQMFMYKLKSEDFLTPFESLLTKIEKEIEDRFNAPAEVLSLSIKIPDLSVKGGMSSNANSPRLPRLSLTRTGISVSSQKEIDEVVLDSEHRASTRQKSASHSPAKGMKICVLS